MKILASFALLFLLALSVHAQQTPEPPPRTVAVSGEGEVEMEPDRVTVRFGVVTEAEDPEVARRQNAEAAAEAMDAVRALDVPERKIQLQTLRLQPKREYVRERREWVEVGYEAIRQVVVELDELEKLPELVTRVVQEGANRLSGLEYGLQDEETARNRALREAVLNARGKAALLAETLGQSLGRPLTISEESFSFPQPVARFDQAMMAKAEQAEAEPAAYAAGEITVTARVQVTFELSDE